MAIKQKDKEEKRKKENKKREEEICVVFMCVYT